LNTHYFNITYTAGRRKKTEDGYSAKKAREILLYKTDSVPLDEPSTPLTNALADLL
jgi:hypothetical protein